MAWYGVIEELYDLENEERREEVGKRARESHQEMVTVSNKHAKDQAQAEEARHLIYLRNEDFRDEIRDLITDQKFADAKERLLEEENSTDNDKKDFAWSISRLLNEMLISKNTDALRILIPIMYRQVNFKFFSMLDSEMAKDWVELELFNFTVQTALQNANRKEKISRLQSFMGYIVKLEGRDINLKLKKLHRLLLAVDFNNELVSTWILRHAIEHHQTEILRLLLKYSGEPLAYAYTLHIALEQENIQAFEIILQRPDSFGQFDQMGFIRDHMCGTPTEKNGSILIVKDNRFIRGEELFEFVREVIIENMDDRGDVVILEMLKLLPAHLYWEDNNALLKSAVNGGNHHPTVVNFLLRDVGVKNHLVGQYAVGDLSDEVKKVVDDMKKESRGFKLVASQNNNKPSVFAGLPKGALRNVVDYLEVTDAQRSALKELVAEPPLQHKIGADIRARIKQM